MVDFDNEVKKYRDSLIREILCLFGRELCLYGSEMILFLNSQMKINKDDLANNTLSKFDKLVDDYGNDFEEALKAFEVEINALYYIVSKKANITNQYNQVPHLMGK